MSPNVFHTHVLQPPSERLHSWPTHYVFVIYSFTYLSVFRNLAMQIHNLIADLRLVIALKIGNSTSSGRDHRYSCHVFARFLKYNILYAKLPTVR